MVQRGRGNEGREKIIGSLGTTKLCQVVPKYPVNLSKEKVFRY